MAEFQPSKYQIAIFDKIIEDDSNILVNAVAGSGKSTTIVKALNIVPEDKKILFLAFNKSIVEELKKKVGEKKNVQIQTLHSLGFSVLRRYYKNISIDNYKYRNYIKEGFDKGIFSPEKVEVQEGVFLDLEPEFLKTYIDNIISLVDLFRANLCSSDEAAFEIAYKFDIEIINNEFEICKKVLHWGRNNLNTIDFTDMIFLPVKLGLKTYQYDWVFIDECQDLNAAQRELFLKCVKPNGHWVGVGDPRQCQPAGTKILMSDGSEKNIEDIEIGDTVVGYDAVQKGSFYGYYSTEKSQKRYNKFAPKVLEKAERVTFFGIYTVQAGEYISRYTYNHKCMAKFNSLGDKAHILYLMRKGSKFRIGIYPLFNKNNDFGLGQRCKQEDADEGWILKIFDNKEEAYENEQIFSYSYGIPQLRFLENTANNQQELIDRVWCSITSISNLKWKAIQLLSFFNKYIDCPIWKKGEKNYFSRNSFRPYQACNLFTKYMDFAIFDYSNKPKIVSIEDIQISSEYEKVYSLKVSGEELYVADKILTHNSIYGFAGADEESFNILSELPNVEKLPLSVCYRCASSIIALAKNIVPQIEARSNAPEGEILKDCSYKDVRDGDMVICRLTKPLVELCMRYISEGIKAYVKGRDIGTSLITLIQNTKQTKVNEVLFSLNQGTSRVIKDIMRKRKCSEKEAMDDPKYYNYLDKIETIEVLSTGIRSTRLLIQRVEEIFGEDKLGICLSTVHKAKGLEAESVFILNKDSFYLSRAMNKDWTAEQEVNLVYVAYTRAKYLLGFIDMKKERKKKESY